VPQLVQDTTYQADLATMEEYRRRFARYNRVKRSCFRRYFRLYHRLEVCGVENIPDGPALVAANHSGGFDLDIVALSHFAHPARPIHPLIAQDWHYLSSAWGRYWVGGGIPLWTRGGIRWDYVDPYLDENGGDYPGLVAIFPEGNSSTFSRRHALGAFFPGVVRIALKYRVPIVPAAMIGFSYDSPVVWEIERDHTANDAICTPFTFPVKLKIEFGAPFELSDYYGMDLSRPEESWVANEVVRPRLAGLLKKHAAVELARADVEMRRPAYYGLGP
jgi:1-acyl-sn-glycerol-3-phosphate acyltransferase